MTRDLRWTLPFDEEVVVDRYWDDDGRGYYVVDRYYGDGGAQQGPYATRKEARAAALELIEQIARDYGRAH